MQKDVAMGGDQSSEQCIPLQTWGFVILSERVRPLLYVFGSVISEVTL